MLKFDRISSTCDCFQSQVKWNSLPNQTNAHTHTHNYASHLNVFCCVLVFWRVVRVYWKSGKVSERSRTRAIPNMTIRALPSRAHAHDGNRLQQPSGIRMPYYFVPLTRGGWRVAACQRAWCACVSYPRWFLLTLLFFSPEKEMICAYKP